jgi:lipopolysaccharide transport system ATP-binding protein
VALVPVNEKLSVTKATVSEIVISVKGLGKKYRIRHQQQGMRYKALRDVLTDKARSVVRGPWSAVRSLWSGGPVVRGPSTEDFWALKDVSFEVHQGETLGIIGRNGAGKSTLLKILSRITEPTEGRVRIKGRVASLLEVGTGFHPELTGRENVFLNGAILGMQRTEIRQKFDEIVAFAEVEKFLDTPVKRYSSGMYVRLAFAVAAHLEPEILVVDEVLAVGDAEFQKKSLGKMQEVSRGGRTVLFVSHNMLAVQKLCSRVILLDSGHIQASGSASEIVAEYIAIKAGVAYSRPPKGNAPQITAASLLTDALRTDAPVEIMIEWFLPENMRNVKVGVGLNTPDGQRIFDCGPEDIGLKTPDTKGSHKGLFRVPPNTLLARHYVVSVGIWKDGVSFDHVIPALTFAPQAGPSGPYAHEATRDGLVHAKCEWLDLS